MSLKDRDPPRDSSFNDFAAAVHFGNGEAREHSALLRAVLFNAFKGKVDFEPFYGPIGIIATEALSHPEYEDENHKLQQLQFKISQMQATASGSRLSLIRLLQRMLLRKQKLFP